MIATDRPARARTGHHPADACGECAVRARGIGHTFDGRRVLLDVGVHVPIGRTVALLGANGAGKSTLLRILATLLRPTEGFVEIMGERVDAERAARARVGFVGHRPMVYGELTAMENLDFFGRLYGVRDAALRAMALLETLGIADRRHDAAKKLSRGLIQRLAIARALMHSPRVLLADEPFAGLDTAAMRGLEACLESLRANGCSVMLSSHEIDRSLGIADRIVVLRDGGVVLDESSETTTGREVSRALEGLA